MASPFAIFRKNQKLMMVALTVLAMVAFVLSDAFDIRGTGGGRSDNPTVVESKYFTLHETQMAQAMAARDLVHRYVVQAVSLALEQEQMRMLRTQLPPQVSNDQLARFIRYEEIARQANGYVNGRFGPVSERAVVETLTLADYGKRIGMQVGDDQVRDFIAQTVQGLLTSEQLNAVLQSIGGRSGGKITIRNLVDAFRTEMLAIAVRTMFTSDPAGVATPVDRWNYYVRKNCRATAEVLPVRTADLVGEVKDPSDAQLTAFFEEFRYFEPVPGSPDPGFKVPQRAAFQYAAAELAKFYEPEKITADAIAAHYDTNKARYPYTEEDLNEKEPAKKPEAGKPEAKKPAEKPAPAEKPKTDDKDAKPKGPTRAESDCGVETEEGDAACAVAPDDEVKKEDAKKSEPPAEAGGPPPVTPAATATPASPPVAAGGSPVATPAATSAPAAIPIATPTAIPSATPSGTAAPAASSPVLPPDLLPTDDFLLPNDIRSGRKPQYDPLWKVEKKIRQELARKAAEDAVTKTFAALRDELVNAALSRDPDSAKPLFTDEQWSELVAKHPGLVGKTTPLLTDSEAQQAAEQPGFFKSTSAGVSVAIAAFAEGAVYVPKESQEFPDLKMLPDRDDGAPETIRYLYWKTKNEPSRVPKLDEIKEQVVFAWKTREARVLARKKAAELADSARQSPKTLREQFPDRDVQLTNAFKWYEVDLAGGSVDGRPMPTRISRVDGVEDPGDEFMQTVFELEPERVGTAMNNPQTICYVVKLTSFNPSRESQYNGFMVDNFQTYIQFAQADAQTKAREALDAVLADSGLHWLREPREREMR